MAEPQTASVRPFSGTVQRVDRAGNVRLRRTGIDARSRAAKEQGLRGAAYDTSGNLVRGTYAEPRVEGGQYNEQGQVVGGKRLEAGSAYAPTETRSNIDRFKEGSLTPSLDRLETPEWRANRAAGIARETAKKTAFDAMVKTGRALYADQQQTRSERRKSPFSGAMVTDDAGRNFRVTGTNPVTGAMTSEATTRETAPAAPGRMKLSSGTSYGPVSTDVPAPVGTKILRSATAFDAALPAARLARRRLLPGSFAAATAY